MIKRSAALLGASLFVVMMAACGDDGGNKDNNDVCGDGHVTGSEQCDDSNTTNGDGCSSTCKTELPMGVCGDHTVDVATEECDDGNTVSGDGCSADCQNESPPNNDCGNGTVDTGEMCDDHNTTAGDGCSGTCTVETGYMCTGMPSVCTMISTATGTCTSPTDLTFTGTTTLTATASGDTTSATNQVPMADCDTLPDEGGGNDLIFKFTTTSIKDVHVNVTPMGDFDPILRVMSAACDPATEVTDTVGGDDGCSDAGYLPGDPEDLVYTRLAAGTYYVMVGGYDDTQVGMFSLTVTAGDTCGNGMADVGETCDDHNTTAGDGCDASCAVETGYTCRTPLNGGTSVCKLTGCGNGFVEGTEECDDGNMVTGDGCDATCAIETGFVCNFDEPSLCAAPGCGNGVLEDTEECDDHNTTNGDRCSSTCILESDVTEVEPNDATGQVITPANHIIRGTLTDMDSDLYTFTLTQPSTVEIETYDTIDGINNYTGVGTHTDIDCYIDDTLIGLYASTGDPTDDFSSALAADDEDGDVHCSYLGSRDSDDNALETGADPTQLVNLPAGTYTLRVVDYFGDAEDKYLIDLKITPMGSSSAVPPAAGDIVINEFLADEGTGVSGDSNCDMSELSSDDEFIEFVNVSNKMLDLTGLTITDAGPHLEFTFAAQPTGSLTLAPGKAVVVWGGGVPACAGATNFFVAPDQMMPTEAQHTLSLNNAGDTITLATGGASPVTIAQTTYGAATTFTSFNLSPEATAGSTTYVLHTAITGHMGTFSPGTKADGTAF